MSVKLATMLCSIELIILFEEELLFIYQVMGCNKQNNKHK